MQNIGVRSRSSWGKRAAIFWMLLSAGLTASAQSPVINAVVNNATNAATLSAGTVATLYGANLATNASGCLAPSGMAWPATLCGSQVTINSVPAALSFVSAAQINFQIPFGLAAGPASVVVTNQSTPSTGYTIQLSAFSPGIVQVNGGSGIVHQDANQVTAADPAAVNEALTFYATGLGPTNPAVAAGAIAPLNPTAQTVTKPVILIDGAMQFAPSFSALAPGFIAYYQVNFVVPQLTPGNHTLAIQSGGISSQAVTLQVAPLMFFQSEVSLGSGVYYQQFPDTNVFGYFNYVANNIFYHYDMGYEAFIPGAGSDVYLYDFTTGHWLYTSTALFPYLYDFTLKAWLYYFPDTKNPGHYTTNPRYFSNLTTGQIITM